MDHPSDQFSHLHSLHPAGENDTEQLLQLRNISISNVAPSMHHRGSVDDSYLQPNYSLNMTPQHFYHMQVQGHRRHYSQHDIPMNNSSIFAFQRQNFIQNINEPNQISQETASFDQPMNNMIPEQLNIPVNLANNELNLQQGSPISSPQPYSMPSSMLPNQQMVVNMMQQPQNCNFPMSNDNNLMMISHIPESQIPYALSNENQIINQQSQPISPSICNDMSVINQPIQNQQYNQMINLSQENDQTLIQTHMINPHMNQIPSQVNNSHMPSMNQASKDTNVMFIEEHSPLSIRKKLEEQRFHPRKMGHRRQFSAPELKLSSHRHDPVGSHARTLSNRIATPSPLRNETPISKSQDIKSDSQNPIRNIAPKFEKHRRHNSVDVINLSKLKSQNNSGWSRKDTITYKSLNGVNRAPQPPNPRINSQMTTLHEDKELIFEQNPQISSDSHSETNQGSPNPGLTIMTSNSYVDSSTESTVSLATPTSIDAFSPLTSFDQSLDKTDDSENEEDSLDQEHNHGQEIHSQETQESNDQSECLWANCGKLFPTLEALIAHVGEEHIGSGKASYKCEWAGCTRMQKPFTKRHKMFNHLRTHTGERPFACQIEGCGKRFSRPDSLATHVKTHSNIRPYICHVKGCGKAYYHSRSLRKHEKIHEAQRRQQEMAFGTRPPNFGYIANGPFTPGQPIQLIQGVNPAIGPYRSYNLGMTVHPSYPSGPTINPMNQYQPMQSQMTSGPVPNSSNGMFIPMTNDQFLTPTFSQSSNQQTPFHSVG